MFTTAMSDAGHQPSAPVTLFERSPLSLPTSTAKPAKKAGQIALLIEGDLCRIEDRGDKMRSVIIQFTARAAFPLLTTSRKIHA